MYKAFSAADYKAHLGLPEDYRVDGMLSYGTWDRDKQIELFKGFLMNSGKQFEYGTLPGFLVNLVEFNVEGRRYWFDVSYGGALLSEYLNLACLFGSRKNILLGTCGGLSPAVDDADFILPTYSWGNESATRMYNPAATDNHHFADQALTASLKERIGGSTTAWEGPTMTCQAMMAETLEDVQRWSREGYWGVEMEAATVFAVSKHFGVPSAALLIVGDNLIKGQTVASESYKAGKARKEEARAAQYKAAIEELLA